MTSRPDGSEILQSTHAIFNDVVPDPKHKGSARGANLALK